MTHISNFSANFYCGLLGKKLRFPSFRTTYIFSVLGKLLYHGFCRGSSFNLKSLLLHFTELKYDFSFFPIVRIVKLVSSSSFRVYLKYIALIYLYFRTQTIVSSTDNGVYFGFELLLSRLNLGGESVIKFNFA